MSLPLEGVRVLDTVDEQGALCGRLVADLGADVVRPDEGASRTFPPLAPDGSSLWFSYRNAGKRFGSLEPGDADIVLDAGTLDAAALIAEHPHLVVTSITGFGLTGPYKGYVATNLVSLAMGGLLHNSGWPDRPPLAPPGTMADDAAGIVAAFATLAAYWQRLRTGRGQHIDLSVMETCAQLGDWSLPNGSVNGFAGGVPVRGGSGPVYPIYPCADGYIRVVILSKRQWRALREWMGEPEVLQDDKYDMLIPRLSSMDVLEPLYLELFSRYKKADLAAEAQRRGIVITPVLTPEEVLENEHFASRGTFTRMGDASVPSGFFEFNGERVGLGSTASAQTGSTRMGGQQQSAPPYPPESPVLPYPLPEYPFAGLRVLDFGIGGVGVETARLFAEYGADVIRVESRTYPDFIRALYGTEMTASFASSSRSKRSLGVNCRTDEGREVVHRLAAMSHVVIENSHTGAMRRLGCDYETLRNINPGIVMMSSQLMGSRGEWSNWTGYGPSTRPASGFTHLWNYEDGDMPPGSRSIFPDHLAGRMGALGAVAGVIARERSGSGAHVEMAQVEVAIGMIGDLLMQESLIPGSVVPRGNVSDRGAPWGVYRCAGEERWCAITVRDDDDWTRLVEAVGWQRDPRFDTREARIAERAEIDDALESWTLERTDREVMETLQAAGVPAGSVLYPREQATDPHLIERGFPVWIEQPGVGRMLFEGPAFRASGMPYPIERPAPGLGEHTRVICRDLLGMSDGEIDRLIESGALEGPIS